MARLDDDLAGARFSGSRFPFVVTHVDGDSRGSVRYQALHTWDKIQIHFDGVGRFIDQGPCHVYVVLVLIICLFVRDRAYMGSEVNPWTDRPGIYRLGCGFISR
ncbi:hypothetical protein AC20117_08850 [Arthrobacter crystallopoietes]|nr:hypothetical protein AC20117_08850 [Arthrobacter crystallopoietes]